jgi:Tat protein translocase TatB subunit
MFGIDFSEFILIFIVALIVLGPKQLPVLAQKVGLLFYTLRKYLSSFRQEVYYKSGANQIINTKNELSNYYQALTKGLTPNSCSYNYPEIKSESPNFYQPELDFNKQPELFDEIRSS